MIIVLVYYGIARADVTECGTWYTWTNQKLSNTKHTNLKRPLTAEVLNLAFEKLEIEVQKIKESHLDYFKERKNSNGIVYFQVSCQFDWSAINIFNLPYISFMDKDLREVSRMR